jgi:hypothetical protein
MEHLPPAMPVCPPVMRDVATCGAVSERWKPRSQAALPVSVPHQTRNHLLPATQPGRAAFSRRDRAAYRS